MAANPQSAMEKKQADRTQKAADLPAADDGRTIPTRATRPIWPRLPNRGGHDVSKTRERDLESGRPRQGGRHARTRLVGRENRPSDGNFPGAAIGRIFRNDQLRALMKR